MSESLFRKPWRQIVDTILIYPVVLGVLQVTYAVDSWPPSTWDAKGLVIGLAILGSCAVASTETKVTFAAGLGFMCLAGLIGIPIQAPKHSLQEIFLACIGVLLCGSTAVLLIISRGKGVEPYSANSKPWPVIVAGLLLTTVFVVTVYQQ